MTLDQLERDSRTDLEPRLNSLHETRRRLEQEAEEYARQTQAAVRAALDFLPLFREARSALYKEALAGFAAEVQDRRETCIRLFTRWLLLLHKSHTLAMDAESVARCRLQETDRLAADAETLQAELDGLANRWRTAEDLENLAAQSLVPSHDKVEAIVRNSAPPQAWYDETTNLFEAHP